MDKGFLQGFTVVPMLIILGIFLVVIGGGVLIIKFVPILNIMFRFYMVITIFSFTRRILGPGTPSYIVTGILAYIFVWRLFEVATGVYLTYLIMSFALSGIIIFGLQGLWSRGGGAAMNAAKM